MCNWYHRTIDGNPRIEALTGLRWCAALAVFLSHFAPKGVESSLFTTFCSNGYMGVTIFFVLSGFVLTITYSKGLAEPSATNTWNYAVARVARVIPLYLFVLCLVVASRRNAAPLSALWQHALALQAWSGDVKIAYAWNGPGWSVGVELFLYAMFPLLILLTRFLKSTRSVVWLGIAVVALMTLVLIFFHITGRDQLPLSDPASAHRWIYRSPLLRLGDFTLGICCAVIYARERHRTLLLRAAPLVAAAMSVLILTLMMIPQISLTSPTFDLAYALPGAILILGLALSPGQGIARLLGSAALVLLGELSYAFYLIHAPAGRLLMTVMRDESSGSHLKSAAVWLGCLLLLIALSWVLHISIERPARVFLRKRLSRHSGSQSAPKASQSANHDRTTPLIPET
ncbi:MAG: acyltransferase [Planctomycetota bacterium]